MSGGGTPMTPSHVAIARGLIYDREAAWGTWNPPLTFYLRGGHRHGLLAQNSEKQGRLWEFGPLFNEGDLGFCASAFGEAR